MPIINIDPFLAPFVKFWTPSEHSPQEIAPPSFLQSRVRQREEPFRFQGRDVWIKHLHRDADSNYHEEVDSNSNQIIKGYLILWPPSGTIAVYYQYSLRNRQLNIWNMAGYRIHIPERLRKEIFPSQVRYLMPRIIEPNETTTISYNRFRIARNFIRCLGGRLASYVIREATHRVPMTRARAIVRLMGREDMPEPEPEDVYVLRRWILTRDGYLEGNEGDFQNLADYPEFN